MRGSVVVWCAGEIIGALTDIMAEQEPPRGMRRLGGMFSAPLRKLSFLPQRVGAIARDTRPASWRGRLDQADNSATQIMRSPGAAHNLLLAEQAFGNFTITMSLQPRIEGADRQNEALATLARSVSGGVPRRRPSIADQKAMCRLQANIKISVEKQLDSK